MANGTCKDLMHEGVLERANRLRGEFLTAAPFRHVVVDGFLSPDVCGELIASFPAFDADHARNEMGEVGGKAVFQNLPQLGPAYARLDGMLRSREFLAWLGEVTGIEDLRYDPAYVGGGTHENLNGQDLDPHVDFNYHPNQPLHRRLNLIVFLNPEWQEGWGGALELHVNPWLPPEENRVKSIVPAANRCVIFETTEKSWHGFRRIDLPEDRRHLSRRSIAVYYYTTGRPAEETAPHHSTVYVPRPLPEHLRTGHVLSEEDVLAVRNLLHRRDMQIRYLYEREMELSEALSRVFGSLAFRTYRGATQPVRWLRSWLKAR